MIFDKVDVRPILRGHFGTLRDNTFTNKTAREDIILFVGLPSLLGVAALAIGFRFRMDAVNGFLNVFSILTGLLLNLLVLVLSLTVTKGLEGADAKRRSRLIKEIFQNISFAVLVAVFVVCVALIALSYMRSVPGSTTGLGATFLLAALTANFVLSLLMVLKRIYVLIDKDMRADGAPTSKAA